MTKPQTTDLMRGVLKLREDLEALVRSIHTRGIMTNSQTTNVPKRWLAALEKVFAAEIEGRLLQSKAAIYHELDDNGLVSSATHRYGQGWRAVTVKGYQLTHAGRHLYCSSCKDAEDD